MRTISVDKTILRAFLDDASITVRKRRGTLGKAGEIVELSPMDYAVDLPRRLYAKITRTSRVGGVYLTELEALSA